MNKQIPSHIPEKIVGLDVRVTKVEKKTESHDDTFKSIMARFDSLEAKLDSVCEILLKMDDKVNESYRFVMGIKKLAKE